MGNLVLGKGTQARWREGQDILQLDLFEFGTAAPAALRPTALHGRTALADLVAPAGGGVGTDGPAAGATGRGGPANGDRPGGSGNPIVIEKARIDAEVARLSRLHCEHQETLYKLRSRVRHLTDDIPRLEQRLDAVPAARRLQDHSRCSTASPRTARNCEIWSR